MTLKLLEEAGDQLKEYLEANMAAKVTALNTRYGDTLLENIKQWYPLALPTSTPEAPSICVHCVDWTPKMTQMAKAGIHVSNNIAVVTFVGDDNVENRVRKLCRYTLGVVELLNAGESSMGYNVKLAGPAALSDSLATPPFLQSMVLPILMEQMESY